jgi:adenylate kinase family enzyme
VRRVSVVGNSGSGKSTLGRALAGRLGVPYVELDSIFHQPGWTELEAEEFRARVSDALAADGWVVDGNYRSRVGGIVRDRADTVVWLDYPRHVVMRRVVKRTVRRVVTREELWNGNREPFSNLWSLDKQTSIIAWSWQMHDKARHQYEAESTDPANAHLQWVRLRSPAEADRFLRLATKH